MINLLPFATKELSNGKKLFRRKHGYKFSLDSSGTTTYKITVPYNACKINEAEFLDFPKGVSVLMKVLDSTTGTYTTVPNAVLNQYGFDALIAKDFYRDTSPYDADCFLGMQLEFIFSHAANISDEVGLNMTFHEVV